MKAYVLANNYTSIGTYREVESFVFKASEEAFTL